MCCQCHVLIPHSNAIINNREQSHIGDPSFFSLSIREEKKPIISSLFKFVGVFLLKLEISSGELGMKETMELGVWSKARDPEALMSAEDSLGL